MEPEGTLPRSKKTAREWSYHEPDASNQLPTVLSEDLF